MPSTRTTTTSAAPAPSVAPAPADALQDPLYEDIRQEMDAIFGPAAVGDAPAPATSSDAHEVEEPRTDDSLYIAGGGLVPDAAPAAAAPAPAPAPARLPIQHVEPSGAPIPLPERYAREDYVAGFRGGALQYRGDGSLAARQRTTYLGTEAERAPHRVAPGADGLLHGADGGVVDTSTAPGLGLKGREDEGRFLYTLGPDGDMMAMPGGYEQETVPSPGGGTHELFSHTHHSTMRAGGAVSGAGDLAVKEGFVQEISNASGHYQPDAAHLLHTLDTLHEQGLNLDASKTTLWTKHGSATFPTGPYRESRGNTDLLDDRAKVLDELAAGAPALRSVPEEEKDLVGKDVKRKDRLARRKGLDGWDGFEEG